DLIQTLEKNRFFFGAVEQAVQKDQRAYTWFRVQLLPHTEPQGRVYTPRRSAPDVFPGRACSSRYGGGVARADQGKTKLAPGSSLRK
ncbi:MAG TPA: hypothetical protein VFS18_00695, partial [Actinomycetota bacterium]|nr:hypothetical protein [Actinomycetota bacterium]